MSDKMTVAEQGNHMWRVSDGDDTYYVEWTGKVFACTCGAGESEECAHIAKVREWGRARKAKKKAQKPAQPRNRGRARPTAASQGHVEAPRSSKKGKKVVEGGGDPPAGYKRPKSTPWVIPHMPENLEEMRELATVFYLAGFNDNLPERKAVAVNMAIMAIGAELGLAPGASMNNIWFMQGRYVMSAQSMVHVLKLNGYDFRTVRLSDDDCMVKFYRMENGSHQFLGQSRFTMEDAQRAKLTNRGPWKQYPRAMLFARAISNGIRQIVGGVLMSLYTPDEVQDNPASEYVPELPVILVDEEGNVVDQKERDSLIDYAKEELGAEEEPEPQELDEEPPQEDSPDVEEEQEEEKEEEEQVEEEQEGDSNATQIEIPF